MTPMERAKQPCEHGMRYRGTGKACGYCLAVHEAREAEQPLPHGDTCGCKTCWPEFWAEDVP